MGIVRAAIKQGKRIRVIATETRPKLQGARLTAFELIEDGISVTLITDGMVSHVMQNKLVNKVIVGADRILATGHVFNKIGTSSIAIIADYYNIPFYVAAPLSTFDTTLNIRDVKIEQRDPIEVKKIGSTFIAPKKVPVLNPAFDLTKPDLVDAIITERGIIRAPYKKKIERILKQ